MEPLFDNLSVIRHQFKKNDQRAIKINQLLEEDKLLLTPLAYIRGRSLQNVYFIIDEAQNLTPHEIKTIISRAGAGTKIVLTGDPEQIDNPYLDSNTNGLTYTAERMKGLSIMGHMLLSKSERSELAGIATEVL